MACFCRIRQWLQLRPSPAPTTVSIESAITSLDTESLILGSHTNPVRYCDSAKGTALPFPSTPERTSFQVHLNVHYENYHARAEHTTGAFENLRPQNQPPVTSIGWGSIITIYNDGRKISITARTLYILYFSLWKPLICGCIYCIGIAYVSGVFPEIDFE